MPVAVLLHAFPCDGRMWSAQADALSAAGWDVIVPDLPGFGESDLLDAEPGLDVVAQTVLAEIAAQGAGRVLLAGLSLGGYVAMAIARLAPQVIAGLALCDTKGSADADEAVQNRHRLADAVLADEANCGRILRQSVLPGLLGSTTFAERPEVVDEVGGWLDLARPQTVAWYQRAMATRPASFGTLAALDVPSLVLWGDEDVLSPQPDQRAMLDALRAPSEARIAACGHLSAVERPAEVSAALVGFATGLTGLQPA